MATRTRPADLAIQDAHRLTELVLKEVRIARITQSISQEAAASRAGVSAARWGRLERGELEDVPLELVCRAARAVGLAPSLSLYPTGESIRDRPSLRLLGRFEAMLAMPLRLRREVPIPKAGDLRAWDGRITDGRGTASIEAESRIGDAQALSRRIALKQRDDPGAGAVILVVNRTAHNLRALAEHREALREQFPLDGAAIARSLRAGRVPAMGGIIVL